MFMEFLEVQLGAVALVLAKTIRGELSTKFTHQSVARHFRDHARRRDAQTDAIAIDDSGLRIRKWKDRQAINQNVVRQNSKTGNSDSHRFMGCSKNIDPVDFQRADNPHGPNDL